MIQFGWRDLDAQEALDLDLEQPGRWPWQAFEIGLFGYGMVVCVRVKA